MTPGAEAERLFARMLDDGEDVLGDLCRATPEVLEHYRALVALWVELHAGGECCGGH